MKDKTAWPALDLLSPAARAVAEANANAAYVHLVVNGGGWVPARAMLSGVRTESILASPARSPGDARALLAGLWLWHDWLDESHTISQAIETPTGSFWHAILHRREGDFSNAKYWYARCRHHPALASVAAAGRSVVDRTRDQRLERLVRGEWDPSAFVDVVEAIHDNPGDPLYPTAVALQRAEWRALFAHCIHNAAGT